MCICICKDDFDWVIPFTSDMTCGSIHDDVSTSMCTNVCMDMLQVNCIGVREDMCKDLCVNTCFDIHMYMSAETCAEMCMDMCMDTCKGMCMGMFMGMCMDMTMDTRV